MTVDKENTQQAILLAAEKEFMTHGYDGAKTMRIAAAAGVTHAMLHYYYRTKRNLYEHVVQGKIELLAQSIITAFHSSENLPLVERIIQGAMTHYNFLCANPLLPRFIITQLADDEHRVMFAGYIKQYGTIVLQHLQRSIDQQVATGTIREINAIELLLDVASVNVFPFLIAPMISTVGLDFYGFTSEQQFHEHRKREIETLLRSRLIVNTKY